MVSTLVGFKRFKSKKGNDVCMACIETPFSPAENSRGMYGSDVQSVFMPEEQREYLKESDIGKNVKLNYNIVGGRAYLVELIVDRK